MILVSAAVGTRHHDRVADGIAPGIAAIDKAANNHSHCDGAAGNRHGVVRGVSAAIGTSAANMSSPAIFVDCAALNDDMIAAR